MGDNKKGENFQEMKLKQEKQLETKLQQEEQELDLYLHGQKIVDKVMNKSNGYWVVKHVHASGHGGQNINHGNSKAQLHFNISKFYKDFSIKDKTWDDFKNIFYEKNITKDQSFVVFENQETRYASKNEENVLKHLRQLLMKFFGLEEQILEKEIQKNELELQQLQILD